MPAVGDNVEAAVDVNEAGFLRAGQTYTHARAGERGEVLEVLPGGAVMVRWHRSGTVAQVFPEELSPPGAAGSP